MIKILAIISLILSVSCGRDSSTEQKQPTSTAAEGFNAHDSSNRFASSNNYNRRSRNNSTRGHGPYRYTFNWHYIEYQERQLTSLEKDALEAKKQEAESKTKLNDAQRRLLELAATQLRQEISKLKIEIKTIKTKVADAKRHTNNLNKLLDSGEVNGASLFAFKYFIETYNISSQELRNIKVEPLPREEFTPYSKEVYFPIKEFTASGSVATYLAFLKSSQQNINPESNKAMSPLIALADLINARNQEDASKFESRQKEIDQEMQSKWSSIYKMINDINKITNS